MTIIQKNDAVVCHHQEKEKILRKRVIFYLHEQLLKLFYDFFFSVFGVGLGFHHHSYLLPSLPPQTFAPSEK